MKKTEILERLKQQLLAEKKKRELERVEQIERGYIDRGRQIEGIERALSTSEKDREAERERAEAESERADKATAAAEQQQKEIAELQAAYAQSQKLLEAAGDPDALKKAQEEIVVLKETKERSDGKNEEMTAQLQQGRKENALLKEALENYKQAFDQQDRGRGHEKG